MILNVIENLTGRQVILRLNSGLSLMVEPGIPSKEIPGEEISNNTMVKKLLDRRIIAVQPVEAAKEISPGKGSKTKEAKTPGTPEKTKKQTKPKVKGGK